MSIYSHNFFIFSIFSDFLAGFFSVAAFMRFVQFCAALKIFLVFSEKIEKIRKLNAKVA